jgi:hypothetical protein
MQLRPCSSMPGASPVLATTHAHGAAGAGLAVEKRPRAMALGPCKRLGIFGLVVCLAGEEICLVLPCG